MTEQQRKDYFDKVDKNINEFGYHLTNVFESKERPSFFYSTGIYKSFNLPEIFIPSLPHGLCCEIADNYVKAFKDKRVVPRNEKLQHLSGRFPIFLIDVPTSRLTDYVLSSVWYYKDGNYEYVQVIYPDTQGHFPNDAGYDYDQEILGEFRL
ncbi:DUF4262 domain-containing protein [Chryseolinea lacunae]|uniref:DUF4262 domain-containing protein n=1 Tax=Chryseolinea lacunae TaxID=2801331 RepID=A0ABS1L286_9BACT|nr:DUF4262 domain-containing protein [Chryseolinea lacunae]MBL0745652.1 DUF4262 domain-containing protein [Chryseolinea lacunae]